MILWRLTEYPGLSGSGGLQYAARWHNKGRCIVYAAEHPALAVLEVLAHLYRLPTKLRLMRIEVADGAQIREFHADELPAGWRASEQTSRVYGDDWLDAGDSLLLKVPSALVPHAFNYLINPAHGQAQTHLREAHEPHWLDDRLLRVLHGR